MTREVAIRNLEMIRIAFVNPVTKEQRKLIDDTVDMAISALKGEWIPVTERLPENDTDVLYCSRLGTVGNCHYFNGFNNYPNTTPDYIFEDIIAWLPLPETYKEGGEV